MDFFSRLIALFVFIICIPIFLLVILFLFIFQGMPIFYYHERIGLNFEKIKVIKFRTMKNNSDQVSITYYKDHRITYLGKILRRLKLDELPQLLNIINGDMRFIGPRPEVKEYVNKNTFDFLLKVKPGLSDYASIILRNEDLVLSRIKTDDPYRKVLLPLKIELTKLYVADKSFLLDLKLVLLTIISIFLHQLSVNYLLLLLSNKLSFKTKSKIMNLLKNN